MTTLKSKAKTKESSRASRKYESEAIALQSLRLIAAPRPEDDLSDEELRAFCKNNSTHSSELIQQLIEVIKSL